MKRKRSPYTKACQAISRAYNTVTSNPEQEVENGTVRGDIMGILLTFEREIAVNVAPTEGDPPVSDPATAIRTDVGLREAVKDLICATATSTPNRKVALRHLTAVFDDLYPPTPEEYAERHYRCQCETCVERARATLAPTDHSKGVGGD